jgi:SAM-dependent methyltransferase
MLKEFGRNRTDDYFANPDSYLQNNPYIGLRAQVVRGMLPSVAGKSILDLGCGDGRISIPMIGESDELLLVDSSAAMLERARLRIPSEAAPRVRCQCVQLDEFEPPHKFDVVLCIGVLAHVPDPLATVRLIARSLAPGGSAIIQLTDETSLLGSVTYRLGTLWRRVDPGRRALRHTALEDVRRELSLQGIRQARVYRYVLVPGIRALPPRITRAIVAVTTARMFSRLGGEVLALFSASA